MCGIFSLACHWESSRQSQSQSTLKNKKQKNYSHPLQQHQRTNHSHPSPLHSHSHSHISSYKSSSSPSRSSLPNPETETETESEADSLPPRRISTSTTTSLANAYTNANKPNTATSTAPYFPRPLIGHQIYTPSVFSREHIDSVSSGVWEVGRRGRFDILDGDGDGDGDRYERENGGRIKMQMQRSEYPSSRLLGGENGHGNGNGNVSGRGLGFGSRILSPEEEQQLRLQLLLQHPHAIGPLGGTLLLGGVEEEPSAGLNCRSHCHSHSQPHSYSQFQPTTGYKAGERSGLRGFGYSGNTGHGYGSGTGAGASIAPFASGQSLVSRPSRLSHPSHTHTCALQHHGHNHNQNHDQFHSPLVGVHGKQQHQQHHIGFGFGFSGLLPIPPQTQRKLGPGLSSAEARGCEIGTEHAFSQSGTGTGGSELGKLQRPSGSRLGSGLGSGLATGGEEERRQLELGIEFAEDGSREDVDRGENGDNDGSERHLERDQGRLRGLGSGGGGLGGGVQLRGLGDEREPRGIEEPRGGGWGENTLQSRNDIFNNNDKPTGDKSDSGGRWAFRDGL